MFCTLVSSSLRNPPSNIIYSTSDLDGFWVHKGLFTPSLRPIWMNWIGVKGIGFRARLHWASSQYTINAAMMWTTLLSLSDSESLQNGLQPHSGANPLFSIREELLVSSQHWRCIEADAQCKWALNQCNPAKRQRWYLEWIQLKTPEIFITLRVRYTKL